MSSNMLTSDPFDRITEIAKCKAGIHSNVFHPASRHTTRRPMTIALIHWTSTPRWTFCTAAPSMIVSKSILPTPLPPPGCLSFPASKAQRRSQRRGRPRRPPHRPSSRTEIRTIPRSLYRLALSRIPTGCKERDELTRISTHNMHRM